MTISAVSDTKKYYKPQKIQHQLCLYFVSTNIFTVIIRSVDSMNMSNVMLGSTEVPVAIISEN
ncbi:hypothetical protein L9F63_014051, partial [Diploptera punctata]